MNNAPNQIDIEIASNQSIENNGYKLRDYQVGAVSAALRYFRDDRKGISDE